MGKRNNSSENYEQIGHALSKRLSCPALKEPSKMDENLSQYSQGLDRSRNADQSPATFHLTCKPMVFMKCLEDLSLNDSTDRPCSSKLDGLPPCCVTDN
jgi:hypothetical protein